MDTSTFHESWHRVAGSRITLRPSVGVKRVYFRGERWHVFSDPYSNQYFRARPGAYEFIARLDGSRTVDECWRESLEADPENSPGQGEIIQLLARMHHANLLRGDTAPDSARLFERMKQRRSRELRSRLSSILFVRIPLVDPDRFLVRTLPWVKWFFSPAGAVLWFAVVGLAAKVLVDNASALWAQGQGVLSPSNLPWLYVGMVVAKLLHELGHAYACRRYGGEVHTLGVMLLVFTPVPYVDATSAWGFKSRGPRLVVGAAGMAVEIFVAAVAAFVWAATGPGLVHSLAYNVMFVASVSTVLFNANPLLRFDGYYILSDALDIPNLHQRATRSWRHLFDRYVVGDRKSKGPAQSRGQAAFFLGFGAAAFVYRIFLYAGIILFVASQFLLLGAVMAVVAVVTWVVVPLGKLVNFLASSPRLEQRRGRATAAVAGGAAVLLTLAGTVPFPRSLTAPGVVWSENYAAVFLESPGRLVELGVEPGSAVAPGDLLARFENPELVLERRAAAAELEEQRVAERSALAEPGEGGLAGVRESIAATAERIAELDRLIAALELRAPSRGVWVADDLRSFVGLWLPRGATLGEIIDPSHFRFTAVVGQDNASHLFGGDIGAPAVRLRGQSQASLEVQAASFIPAERRRLPSAALGWAGRGEIQPDPEDPDGLRTAEPFFEVRAPLAHDDRVTYLHGATGVMRCQLPPEPLLQRGLHSLRQLLQKRFGI